jgi:hypothetical protein
MLPDMSDAPAEGDAPRHEPLSISYAGTALESNSMDVRQLAPSLLALADLFVVAHNRVGSPLELPPALEITAQRDGSLVVDMWLAWAEQRQTLIGIMSSDGASAAANTAELAAVVIAGLRWIVKRDQVGGEQSVEPIAPDQIRVKWADGTEIEAPVQAQQLIENMDFRRISGRVFEPLRQQGIDEIDLRSGNRHAIVHRENLRAFNAPPEDPNLISDNTRVVTIRVETLGMNPGNKWRVNDGSGSVWVSINDLGFVDKMVSGEERFAPSDVLVVEMRDRQFRDGGSGFVMERSIERVLEHRITPSPDELPFDDA